MTTRTPKNAILRRAALSLLALAALCVPATASAAAKLPHPKDPLIKVPKSIGGAKLGTSLKNAAREWRVTNACGAYVCSFGAFYGKSGIAEISAATDGPKVVEDITVRAAAERKGLKKPLFVPALGRFETKEGIGLGSRVKALKKAYPKAHQHGKEPFVSYVVSGKGKSYMSFGFDRFRGRELITSVTLDSGR